MENKTAYKIAYIISNYLDKNPRYLSGTFSRIPIYLSIVENYSVEDIREAFNFLDKYGILRSSVRESKGFVVIYSVHKYKLKMFLDVFWGECDYATKVECKNILRGNTIELLGGVS